MKLKNYFNFLTPNDIRLRGSRIGIETILYDYIYRQKTPEEIAKMYPTIKLEQVYATILYYLHNQEKVSKYIQHWLEHCYQGEQEQDQNPPPFILKMRKLKAEILAKKSTHNEYSISN